MKKWFLSTLVVLSLAGCNETDDLISIDMQGTTSPKRSQLRSYEEAKFIALQSISMLDSDSDNSVTTRGASSSRTLQDKDTYVVCVDPSETRSSESFDNDTLMYVFNFENNQGFAIVSAEKGTEGLIAVIESGHYNPSDTIDTGFRRYMTAAKLYISANRAQENTEPNRAPKGFYYEIDTTAWCNIPARITVKWGQNFHEGQFCPNQTSGCSNTAAAMIMSYFEYPTLLEIRYNGFPYTYRTLNWSGIKNYINRYSCSYAFLNNVSSCTNEDHKSVGHLCRELAERAESTFYYDPNSTLTETQKIRNTLSDFGYTVGSITSYQNLVNTSTIRDHLSDGKLIYMRGSNNTENSGGHAWVIDGYYGFTVHSCYYEYGFTNGLPDPPVLMDEQYHTHRYNHINWGYNGNNNGYFVDGVFSYYETAYNYDNNFYVHATTDPDLIADYNFANSVLFFTIYKN